MRASHPCAARVELYRSTQSEFRFHPSHTRNHGVLMRRLPFCRRRRPAGQCRPKAIPSLQTTDRAAYAFQSGRRRAAAARKPACPVWRAWRFASAAGKADASHERTEEWVNANRFGCRGGGQRDGHGHASKRNHVTNLQARIKRDAAATEGGLQELQSEVLTAVNSITTSDTRNCWLGWTPRKQICDNFCRSDLSIAEFHVTEADRVKESSRRLQLRRRHRRLRTAPGLRRAGVRRTSR